MNDALKNGPFELYYSKNRISRKGNYLNDMLNGAITDYDRKGNLKTKKTYKNGYLHGIYEEYDTKGNLISKKSYQNDFLEGECKFYYPNGNLSELKNYKNDLLQGKYEIYHPNGNIRIKGNCINGILDVYQKFDSKGKLLIDSEAMSNSDNSKNGNIVEYYDNGKVKLKANYNNNLKEGLFEQFYDNGQLMISTNYIKGRKYGEFKFFSKYGELVKKTHFKDNLKEGLLVEYDSIGELKERTMYENNIKNGFSEIYSYSEIQSRKNYKNGILNGISEEFYDRNFLKSVTWYKDGLKHGIYEIYDKAGNLIYLRNFEEGAVVPLNNRFNILGFSESKTNNIETILFDLDFDNTHEELKKYYLIKGGWCKCCIVKDSDLCNSWLTHYEDGKSIILEWKNFYGQQQLFLDNNQLLNDRPTLIFYHRKIQETNLLREVEIRTTHHLDKNLVIKTDLTDEQISEVVNELKKVEIADDFYIEKAGYLSTLKGKYPDNMIEEIK